MQKKLKCKGGSRANHRKASRAKLIINRAKEDADVEGKPADAGLQERQSRHHQGSTVSNALDDQQVD